MSRLWTTDDTWVERIVVPLRLVPAAAASLITRAAVMAWRRWGR